MIKINVIIWIRKKKGKIIVVLRSDFAVGNTHDVYGFSSIMPLV